MKRINGMERWFAYQNWYTSYNKQSLSDMQIVWWAMIAIIAMFFCAMLIAVANS